MEKEIEQFHEKYDTMVGERGVTLSGGQKQRISIARALAKDPQIVVFDDCLSAVDARTEKEILGNLSVYLKHKTAIIITHRIFYLIRFWQHCGSWMKAQDREIGTHSELLSAKRLLYVFIRTTTATGAGEKAKMEWQMGITKGNYFVKC